MRLEKETYNKRILLIVGQYMRITDMRGIPHERISVRRLAVLNGFTYAYDITSLSIALPLVHKWIWEKREESRISCGKPYTPSPQDILEFTLNVMHK